MSQTEQIINHLHSTGPITPLDALSRYGVLRLAARIREIKDAGFRIQTRTVNGVGGKHWAEYRLS